ncbi:MAG TPA: 2-C-methyl-D-erythritol 2,4-cyclodiphosphate synthase [Syntrophomonadaceae bacterium]|nr:2-C-methyl-D-erythritol 2,4-cyclodiphosphate synthase [Syntrophomonadaceae bacterium]
MRIGIGYDVHRLSSGRKLIIGGVDIPNHEGLLGHSDADVLTHAICDALLGAAALGDIGQHFPDNDEKYRDISSLVLLKEIGHKLQGSGYFIHNIDSVIIAEKPKLAPYIPQMCQNIAGTLNIGLDKVNVKATTSEGLGFAGRGEGMAAKAVVLLGY